eukprot:scaffold209475_cov73-Cyclotella_meneghiniana.AAC.1
MFLASIYHPHKKELYEEFNDLATSLLQKAPQNAIKIIGHDINASLGIRHDDDPEELHHQILGPHGLNNRNEKGIKALNFLQQFDLKVMTSFFKHNTYTTHLSNLTSPRTPLTLDSISVSGDGSNRVRDCYVWNKGVDSDHSAIKLTFCLSSIKFKESTQLSKGVIDWHTIKNDESKRQIFNSILKEKTHNKHLNYTSFNEAILEAGFATATKPKYERKGWWENDRQNIQPLVTKKAELHHQLISNKDPEDHQYILEEYKKAKKDVKDRVEIAKSIWASKLASEINDLNVTPKRAWEAAYEIKDGVKGHHKTKVPKRFRNSDGVIASTPQENRNNVEKHFNKVFNTIRPYSTQALESIKQRETLEDLDLDPTWEEFKRAVTKLKNDKKPGPNGVMPNAFKCMDNHNLTQIYNYIIDFWHNDADYPEWHTSTGSLVPKKGDLYNLNQWRCINLMDVGSKILSCILTERTYRLLEKYGTKTQYGATPLVGCQEGSFTLKTLLHLRHQHNLPSYVAFVDLVKAYDTANHEVLLALLERYGAPPPHLLQCNKKTIL